MFAPWTYAHRGTLLMCACMSTNVPRMRLYAVECVDRTTMGVVFMYGHRAVFQS